jgi:LacI family transcriptional regulator
MNDDANAVRESVSKLFALGHRRIGFCGGPLKKPELNSASRRCFEAFKTVAADFGLSISDADLLTYGDEYWVNKHRDMRMEMLELLKRPDRPTALVVSTHHFARSAVEVCGDLGLRVPKDLSLIACGGYDPSREMVCDSFVKNRTLLGEETVNSLMNWIADPLFKPECRLIRADFVEQGSVAAVNAG